MNIPTSIKKKLLVPDIKPTPTKERSSLGKVSITIEEGTEITAVGVIYGMHHTITGSDFSANLFLDNYNQRIKILNYSGNIKELILKTRKLAELNGFDKIICFTSRKDWQKFLRHGYVLESVLKYYNQGEDAYIVSKFRSQERLTSNSLMEETLLVESIMEQEISSNKDANLEGFTFRKAVRDDIPKLIELYQSIFETYPSPLIHADYLESIFGLESIFCVAEKDGKIVAAASAELDIEHLAAELTDCATHPEARGKGLMSNLLKLLEQIIFEKGFVCSYTMARAKSFGMNSIFYQLGYEFLGRLVNNCDIYGAYEDMNIWGRNLRER